MVSLHFFKLKVLFTDRADAFKSLVRFSFLILGERSNVQMPFCSIQDVGIDTLLVCDIIISHEPSDFFFDLGRIDLITFMCVV